MYKTKNHAKYSLIAHLIFVVKYRHPLLKYLGQDTKSLVKEACRRFGYNLISCMVHIDHIHILLEYRPSDSISSVVKSLKQYTTYHLRQVNDELISKYIYGNRRFWSKGCFVCSIGKGASYETIRQHIDNQG